MDKREIEELTNFTDELYDRFKKCALEFCEYPSSEDSAGNRIDRNSGACRQQLHEHAKMLRREILKIDKLIYNKY